MIKGLLFLASLLSLTQALAEPFAGGHPLAGGLYGPPPDVAVTGPGSATDGQIVLFDGTSGAILKAGTGTGLVKATSGVVTFASLVNADVSASAAIDYSKLNLATSITNADIATNAAIAYSKLNLGLSIVNADISASAALARSKIAAGTASRVLVNDGSGLISESSTTTTTLGYLDVGSSLTTLLAAKAPLASPSFTGQVIVGESSSGAPFIVKSLSGNSNGLKMWADSVSDAAYIYNHYAASFFLGSNNASIIELTTGGGTKLLNLTASTVPYLDASKVLTSSAVTPTELGYLSGVTSAVQTQLGGKVSDTGDTMTGSLIVGTASGDSITISKTNDFPSMKLEGGASNDWGMSIGSSGEFQLYNNAAANAISIAQSSRAVTLASLSAGYAVITNGSNELASSGTSSTALGYISTLSSNAQTQLDAKAPIASPTFTGTLSLEAGSGSDTYVRLRGNNTTSGVNQYGLYVDSIFSTSSTSTGYGITSAPQTVASAFTQAHQASFVAAAIEGAGSTITRHSDYYTTLFSSGTYNAVLADNATYAADYFIHSTSTRPSLLSGNLSIVGSNNLPLTITGTSSAGTLRFINPAASGKYNWLVGGQYNVNNSFEITPSTATDGTTFSTPVAQVDQNGAWDLGIAGQTILLRGITTARRDQNGRTRFFVRNDNTGSSATAELGLVTDAGDVNIYGTSLASGASAVIAADSTYTGGTVINQLGSNPITLRTNSTDRITIAGTGLVTIAGNLAVNGVITGGFAEVDDGNSSTADTIDWSTGSAHKSTLTGNVTYTFTAPSQAGTPLVLRVLTGAGSYTATWPATVKWASGTAPTITTTASRMDLINFYWDGTNYYGSYSQNYTP